MTQDTSLTPDNEQAEPQNATKVYVDLSTLTEDGVSPEIGDQVSISVTGTVNSIEGNVACVQPETVNGAPAPQPTSERDQLRGQMEQMDQQGAQGGY